VIVLKSLKERRILMQPTNQDRKSQQPKPQLEKVAASNADTEKKPNPNKKNLKRNFLPKKITMRKILGLLAFIFLLVVILREKMLS
jgi:hypothetical protein